MNDRHSSSGFDLSRERWELIQKHLDALEALTKAEWCDYLDSACPDPEVRRVVLAFHDMYVASTGHLDSITEPFVTKRADTADLSGKRIGAYRLLKSLGRGGMGVVYEAERADGAFEQRVALKLLSTALTGGEAHLRFLNERRILAGLEHPSIARILDGGVTNDGTPWFAMEHVEGLPIDVFCDQHELGIHERLELFLQVCDAVEHAHRRLVVHRDLKPANVLVTSASSQPSQKADFDGERQIKLLDFGIAKLRDADDGDAAPATRTSLRMMTPEYASPEQVRGKPVTTSSDVYQLGLLLYELLTGHRPYVLHRRSAGDLERAICEQPPTRLSAAVTREDTIKITGNRVAISVAELCRLRGSSPAKLRRRLRDDLENIVLKALSKEPERRYGSVDRLAQDIRRHLTGLPVSARPDTWAYRSRKFFRRHAVGAATTVMVVALIGGMTGFYVVNLHRAYEQAETERVHAQTERDRAETALVRAEAEAQKARQVSEFLSDIFRNADPLQSESAGLVARELIDRGVRQVDAELAGQPAVQAEMLRVLGRTYLGLSNYDSAEEVLTRAFKLQRQRLGPEHPEMARIASDLGWLRFVQGRYLEARRLLEEALQLLESSNDDDENLLAEIFRYLGPAYRELGDHEAALEILERALAIQERVTGENSRPVSRILNSIGIQLDRMGELDRAEAFFNRVLAVVEQTDGAESAAVGTALMNLATTKKKQGFAEDAGTLYQRALAILEDIYGQEHLVVAVTYFNLGTLFNESGHGEQAVAALETALEGFTAFAPDHPDAFALLNHLGTAHFINGEFDRARSYFQQGLAKRRKAGHEGRQNEGIMNTLTWLGRTEMALDNEAAASRHLSEALDILRRAPEPAGVESKVSLNYLSHWLAGQRLCREARSVFMQARNIPLPGRTPAFALPDERLEAELAECEEA